MLKNIETALSKIIMWFGFLGYYTSGWEIHEDSTKCQTMATDYNNLFYNPEWCKTLKVDEMCGVLIHEITHCLFLHPSIVSKELETNKIQYLWTIALEMVTNAETIKIIDSIQRGGDGSGRKFCLPGEPFSPFKDFKQNITKQNTRTTDEQYWYDCNYKDSTSIQIYEELLKVFKDIAFKIPVNILSAAGINGHGEDEQSKLICSECGHEVGRDDKKCPGCGRELLDLPSTGVIISVSDKQKKQEAAEKAIAVTEKMEKAIGSLPNGIARHIKMLKASQVPWTRILMAFLGNIISGVDDYSWEKPNHRHPMAKDIIMPGLITNEIDDIVFAIDTSGSMSNYQLGQIASELGRVQSIVNEVVVYTTDAAVHERVKASSLSELFKKLHFKGCGGTDFNPIFNEIKKCAAMVFFSDCMATFPNKKPNYPVLWILTKENQLPPFGKVVYVLDV